jgi:uncharacterized membrane protein YphA (DoxX/SURF4 family)
MATIAAAPPYTEAKAAPSTTGVWSWLTTVDHKRIGALYLITGLFFRPMMIPLFFTMLVAAFVGHAGKGFSAQAGGNEYALTLAVAVLALFFTGPGRLALGAQAAK